MESVTVLASCFPLGGSVVTLISLVFINQRAGSEEFYCPAEN
jgi:hypothetical protein